MIGKLRLLFLCGVLVLFLPYLYLPSFWKTLVTILLGLGIIGTTYRLRRVYKMLKLKLKQETTQARHEEEPTLDIHA